MPATEAATEQTPVTMLEFSKTILLCLVLTCIVLLAGCKDDEEVFFSSGSPSLNPSVGAQSAVNDSNSQSSLPPTQSRDEYTDEDDVMLPENAVTNSQSAGASSQVTSTGSESAGAETDTPSQSDGNGSSQQTITSSEGETPSEEPSSSQDEVGSEEATSSSESSSKKPSVTDPIVLPDDIW